MPASRAWAQAAARELGEELGYPRAHKLVCRLLKLPGANQSVKETLKRLAEELRS